MTGVNIKIRVHNAKIRSNGLERSQIRYTMIKLSQMFLKGVNWVHNDKLAKYIRS